jgi:hypothetical protein
MSTKIIKKLEKPNKITLTEPEFSYMNSLDTVGQSFAYYINQLKLQYLRDITVRNGWTIDDELELTIDLKDESHELSVKPIDKPPQV